MPSRRPQQVQFPGSPPFLLELGRLSDTCIIWPASILERCLHDGDNLQTISGVGQVVPCRSNQPLAEVFCSHSWRTVRAVQAKPAYRPGGLFILRDIIVHQERRVSHRYRLSQKWDMPVELFSFLRNCGKGHYGWGWGRSTADLYHPQIRIDASWIGGGSDVRRDSTSEPLSAARMCLSP